MIDQISYVVTVYNKADFLPRVLTAVAAEHAGTGGEIIIVDDGSTDESPDLLAEFAVENAAVRVLRQSNQGVAVATNAGLAAASCPFIRLVDGDDVLVAGSTIRLAKALQETGAGFAYGQQIFIETPSLSSSRLQSRDPSLTSAATEIVGDGFRPSGRSDETKSVKKIISDPLRLMLTNQPFIPSVTLGRREIMQACLPLPVHHRTAQDFALGLALAARTRFAALATPCCISPQQPGLSSSKARMFQDTALLCLDYGERQNWPLAYRNLALQRNAGRARNYLRRHLPQEKQAIQRVSVMAVLAKLPVPWPFTRWLRYIAAAYQPAVADYRNHA
jgi:hypothetical protein